ncbi:MAG: tRNA pseudouridine(38-40) synthase TruA, partial [Chloroflexota bacterium]
MALTGVKKIRDVSSGRKVMSLDGDIENPLLVENTTRVVLLLEYDGSQYHGFQLQENLPTIQGEIEKALKKLTGDSRRVITASRTDTGVHARGQVVSFRTGSSLAKRAFVNGLNYYMPNDIAVKAAYMTGESFRVRSQAINREYKYYILNSPTRSPLQDGYSHLVSGELDIEAMNLAAKLLVGEHDLVSFASNLGVELKSTKRRVYKSEINREGEMVIFNIIAGSFLPHQVRNTVGALIRVGLGRMT